MFSGFHGFRLGKSMLFQKILLCASALRDGRSHVSSLEGHHLSRISHTLVLKIPYHSQHHANQNFRTKRGNSPSLKKASPQPTKEESSDTEHSQPAFSV